MIPTVSRADVPEDAVIETTLIAEVDSSVVITLDGDTLDDTRLHRGSDGEIYVDALPIFETLGNQVEFDSETKALIVRRSQDGVVMELYTDTGIVKADGKALGSLPTFGRVDMAEMILTPNAIAVLAGANGKMDKENNSLEFELDPRLRITSGFDLIVNGVPIGQVDPPPKSVGPILLLPLRPLAEELGHVVTLAEGGGSVRVERAQDSAVFTLNLDTGLVSLYDNPIGFSEDVSYIDPIRLLVPVSAFETLTGTNVTAGDGSNIRIDLDNRLTDAVAPDGEIADIAADTPFEIEYAAFEIGLQSVNRVEIGAHGGALNGRLRLELGEIPTELAELEPDWVSVDLQHFNGLRGSLGDNSADFRELDGVGVRRYRGISVQTDTEDGKWAFAAGTPAATRRDISADQTRLTFSGLAAGARYRDDKGWEAGFSVRHDPSTEDQMAVLSAISGSLGRYSDRKTQWDASASLGVFNGPSRDRAIDAEARGQLRHDLTDTVRFDASAQYNGAEFTRSVLRAEDLRRLEALQTHAAEQDERLVPDVRQVSADSASVGVGLSAYSAKTAGPLGGLGATLRVQHDRSGLLDGTTVATSSTAVSATASAVVEPLNLSMTAGGTIFKSNNDDADTPNEGKSAFATIYSDFSVITARARVDVIDTDLQAAQTTASLNLSTDTLRLPLPKAAGLSLRPSATAAYRQGDWTLRGGLYANLESGALLGEKTRVNASLGIIQSASGRSGSRTNRFLNVSVARRLKIGDNMALGLGYRADLRGNHQLGLLLQGRYDFAPARRLRKTKADTGLLQGQAFLDENGDGIRQSDEPGAGGVIVRVQGTPFALRTGASGSYSVQNLRRGLYQIGVDNRSLPLGYGLDTDAALSVSIRPGHVTTLDLPILRFGQIRGNVYVDADGSGVYERGEARPESVTVELRDLEGSVVDITATTAFGQFAFDALPIGDYVIATRPKVGPDGTPGPSASPTPISLSETEGGMARIRLGLIPSDTVLSVEANESGDDNPQGPEPPLAQSTGLPPP